MRKKLFQPSPKTFRYLNVFLPLVFGMLLYTFIRQDGLLNLMEKYIPFFYWLRNITYFDFVPKSPFGIFIKNQLGDLLWAYALEVSLVLSTGNLKKAAKWGGLIAIATECCQLFPFIYATFDVLDIAAQVSGVILAYIVTSNFYRHWLS